MFRTLGATVLLLKISLTIAYRPVFIYHGILTGADSMGHLVNRIQEVCVFVYDKSLYFVIVLCIAYLSLRTGSPWHGGVQFWSIRWMGQSDKCLASGASGTRQPEISLRFASGRGHQHDRLFAGWSAGSGSAADLSGPLCEDVHLTKLPASGSIRR